MSDHSNDEKRKNIPDRNIQRMSKPNDESMGKRRPHTSEEEQLPEKIEKVTESLLSQWEISEDDFEDTQDLAETAAQLSDYEERPVRSEGERRTETVSYTHLLLPYSVAFAHDCCDRVCGREADWAAYQNRFGGNGNCSGAGRRIFI